MVIMANPDDGCNDKFDNKIDWLSIPLTSILLSMAVLMTNTMMRMIPRSTATATPVAYAVAGGKMAPANPRLPSSSAAAAKDKNNNIDALHRQVSPPPVPPLSLPPPPQQ
jgi:hypothetical protein